MESYPRLLLRHDGEADEQFVALPVGFQWPRGIGEQVSDGYTLTELTGDPVQELLGEDEIKKGRQGKSEKKRTKTGMVYTCSECDKKFQYQATLAIHKRFHSGEKLKQCDECGKRFGTKYALKRHIKTHETHEMKVCNTCGAAFLEKADYDRHMRFHATGEPAYKCKDCGDTFDTYGALKAHRSKKHREHWKCRHCYEKFPTEKLYKEHRVVHETYSCPQCNMKFITLEMLNMHIEEAGEHRPPPNFAIPSGRSSKDAFECDICGKRFTRRDCLIEHYRLHTGIGLVACNQCPMKFTTYARLRKHMGRHATKKSYPCAHCDKVFGTERYLRIHMMKHMGEQLPYPCQLCPKQFLRSNSLRNHMFTHLKRFPCSRCPAIFTSDRQLKKHRRTHKSICSICTITFETFELLHMHFQEYHPESDPPEPPPENPDGVLIAEGLDVDTLITEGIDAPTRDTLMQMQLQFTCEVCDKQFSRATDLRIHMCTHAKSFPCSHCFQTFTSERKLKKHRKINHKNICNYCGLKFELPHYLENHYKELHPDTREARGEPPLDEPIEVPKKKIVPPSEPRIYPCHICSKEFARGPDLRIHLCTHKKNFKCSQCSQTFSSQRRLKRHRKLHKNICPLCETKFETQDTLREHIDEHHPDSGECRLDSPDQEDSADDGASEQLVSCLLCDEQFSRNSDLRTHMRTHAKTFPCRQCGLVLPTGKTLREHQKVHRIICEICKESLDTIALAQLHYLEDHPDEDMPVFVVPMSSGADAKESSEDDASNDKADDAIEPDFTETWMPDASFGDILNVHAASEQCKETAIKHEVKEEQVDEDVKEKIPLPFICEICGKGFAKKNSHKNHMYSHAKSFPCRRCSQTFPSERQLKKHKLEHRISCKDCDASFASKTTLETHCRKVHADIKKKRRKAAIEEVFIEADPFVDETPETNPIEEIFFAPCENEFLDSEILGDG